MTQKIFVLKEFWLTVENFGTLNFFKFRLNGCVGIFIGYVRVRVLHRIARCAYMCFPVPRAIVFPGVRQLAENLCVISRAW